APKQRRRTAARRDSPRSWAACRKSRRAGEEDLMAFTEEEVRLLGAAFDHVWARLSDLQDRCDAETERIDALGLVLADQGLITPDQWETAIAQLALRTGMEAQMLSRSR